MPRSARLIVLCLVTAAPAILVNGLLRPQALLAQNAAGQIPPEVRAACMSDVQNLCAGVQPGGGRILACLKQHQQQVSDRCKQAIMNAMQQQRGSGSPGASATTNEPTPTAPSAPVPSPDTPAPAGGGSYTPSEPPAPNHPAANRTTTMTAAGAGPRYFLMKQVKIIDQGLGKGMPAYDLMVPTTWDFKGWVNFGVAEGGCFADSFSVVAQAKNADGSVGFQMFPQYTWQYIDDPNAQRQMQVQNQRDAQVGMKPCPVRAPITAAEFLRQDIVPKYLKGKDVVSIESFPELDQIVRYRLGLPPTGSTGDVRTDAARARVEITDGKGRPAELWVTAAIVVRIIPTGGRGAAYDWHAIKVMFFQAPKGQLDANDRLFKLILSTIRPEPEWQKFSNGVVATLYQKKQIELAKQSQIIADFQNQVVQTINGVVADRQAGSNHAAYGESQILRGVQTFRDPNTGATYELSNKFDHAWLNGSNQYVMSDDPSFNPTGSLNGNWTSLEPVR